jgi:hypothetical protein
MVVDPDFPDHWKTRMLVDLLSDEAAPMYVIRIWAHCQMRRQWVFDNLPPSALKALCRYTGHANQLESALVTSGFVRRDGAGVVTVNDWEIYNASLVANWSNGKKGGRRQKSLDKEPMGNPWVAHGQPMANPRHLIQSNPLPSSSDSSSETREPFEADTEALGPGMPGFTQFMNAYPRHRLDGDSTNRRLWLGMNCEPNSAAILAGLEAHKASGKWQEAHGQFVPKASNFLKNETWNCPPMEATNGPDHRNQSNRRPSPEDARRAADRAQRVGGGEVGPIPILGRRGAG